MPNTYQKKHPKKPLTNSTTSDRKDTPPGEQGSIQDPSIPLSDPKEEHFAELLSQNIYGQDCWIIAMNPKSSKKRAKDNASKLRAKKYLASRVAWLKANKHSRRPGNRPAGRAAAGIPDTPEPQPTRKPPEDTSLSATVFSVLLTAFLTALDST